MDTPSGSNDCSLINPMANIFSAINTADNTANYVMGVDVTDPFMDVPGPSPTPAPPMPRIIGPCPPTADDIWWGKIMTQADAAVSNAAATANARVILSLKSPSRQHNTPIATTAAFASSSSSATPTAPAAPSSITGSVTAGSTAAIAVVSETKSRKKVGRKLYKEPDADAVAAAAAYHATLSPTKQAKIARNAKAAATQRERGAKMRMVETWETEEYEREAAASEARTAEWALIGAYINERPTSTGVNWRAGLSGIRKAIESLEREKKWRNVAKKKNDDILATCTPSQIATALAFEKAHPCAPNVSGVSYSLNYYREWCAVNGYTNDDEEKEADQDGDIEEERNENNKRRHKSV